MILGEIGLVDYEPYHGVHLTKQGQHVADVIEHRFNILQRFLTDVLGVEKEEAAEVACRMEHILTRDVENRLTNFLGATQDKSSDLFCDQVNIDTESDPDFFSAIKICKKRRIGPCREESNRPLFYKKDISILARSGFSYEISKRVLEIPKKEFKKFCTMI